MSSLRFWKLANQNNSLIYLDWQTGEQLQALLDRYQEDSSGNGNPGLPMFWSGEDIVGAPVTVRVDFIRDLIAFTPDTQAREDDPDGPMEYIRLRAIEQDKKKWTADDDDYKR